jgi:hypothetical protein
MNDERLKNLGGGNYWKELLDRIRDPLQRESDVPASVGSLRHRHRLPSQP